MRATRLKPGESNDRWIVKAYLGGATPVKYVFKCKSCGRSKTATKQLYDRGFCECRHKQTRATYKKEYRERVKNPDYKKDVKQIAKQKKAKKKKEAPTPSNVNPLPKQLSATGVRNLCFALLHQAILDSKKKDLAYRAEAFINSDWCKEICENIEIDYKSYVQTFYKKVL